MFVVMQAQIVYTLLL